MSKLPQSPNWEYLGVPQIGSGDSHFIVSMMKHQSRRDPHIHKDVAGTAQGTGNAKKNQTQEVSTLWEFPLRWETDINQILSLTEV